MQTPTLCVRFSNQKLAGAKHSAEYRVQPASGFLHEPELASCRTRLMDAPRLLGEKLDRVAPEHREKLMDGMP